MTPLPIRQSQPSGLTAGSINRPTRPSRLCRFCASLHAVGNVGQAGARGLFLGRVARGPGVVPLTPQTVACGGQRRSSPGEIRG